MDFDITFPRMPSQGHVAYDWRARRRSIMPRMPQGRPPYPACTREDATIDFSLMSYAAKTAFLRRHHYT